ncbi:MAG: nucleotidyltransferase family protein [Caulobacter sp.]|nr:nucleotidyltransferase family protein [Caulobacter sp.]
MAKRESTRLEAIVLAAGAGRRFGGRKLVAPFRGRPLIAGALDAAFAAPVRTVTVVTAGDAEVAATVRDHARSLEREADLRLVVADSAAEGMGASLRTGAASLPADTEGAFVFLGDMPRIPREVGRVLVALLDTDHDMAAPAFKGRRGHPVLFGQAWLPALLGLVGDVGAQAIVASAGARLAVADGFGPEILFDIDRREDLA